ncbi:hypothetical protein ACIBCR_14795 [Micromonospora echinospora]|uniref:hypothetical protein n=1 Tax=Micromonospora echinospora TaxID=1877 RepID=UPI0037A25826
MTEPWMEPIGDPWTPDQAENALRWVLRAMYDASKALKASRDAEVDAKHAFEKARREAFFSPDCPKPERGGYTVADREAHIERATASERQAYELASAAKEAAQDHLRTLNSQSVVLAALSKNVNQTYNVVGAR